MSYNEIKSLTLPNIANGVAQMTNHALTWGSLGYSADVFWHVPPNVLVTVTPPRGLAPATIVYIFNAGGILFYTDDRTTETIVATLGVISLSQVSQVLKPLAMAASSVNIFTSSKFLISSVQAIDYAILRSQMAFASTLRI